MKEQLVAAVLALVGGGIIAVLTWWLTERSRDHADAAKDRAVAEVILAQQSDAFLLAVIGLRASRDTNHFLWERLLEHGRSILLASLAAGGGWAQHDEDAPEWRRFLSAGGAASQILAQDRIAAKTATMGLKADLARLAAAAVPLMRHPDAGISTTTEKVLKAAIQGGGRATPRLDRALEQFGEAVRAVLPSWAANPDRRP